jgi:hypothetical protein
VLVTKKKKLDDAIKNIPAVVDESPPEMIFEQQSSPMKKDTGTTVQEDMMMDQLVIENDIPVVAEEYIIENVEDEVHVERSAVTIESRDDTLKEPSDQPMKEIVNKNSSASKTASIRNNIAEHSYSFNTEKSNNDDILDDDDDDENYESEPDEPTPKVKSNQKPNFSNMALVAMALQNLPEQRGTVFEIIDWIQNEFPYFATLEQEKFCSTVYGVMNRKPFIKIDNYRRGGKFRIDFTEENQLNKLEKEGLKFPERK